MRPPPRAPSPHGYVSPTNSLSLGTAPLRALYASARNNPVLAPAAPNAVQLLLECTAATTRVQRFPQHVLFLDVGLLAPYPFRVPFA